MGNLNLKSWLKFTAASIALVMSESSYASNSGSVPYTKGLSNLADMISGPVLTSIAIIMIVVTCAMLAFNHELGAGAKIAINIVLWLSVAMFAAPFVTNVIGGNGALL